MSERYYLTGLPVAITVSDDGTVTAEVCLEEAGDIETEFDTNITKEQLLADSATINAAFDAGTIVVTHNLPPRSAP